MFARSLLLLSFLTPIASGQTTDNLEKEDQGWVTFGIGKVKPGWVSFGGSVNLGHTHFFQGYLQQHLLGNELGLLGIGYGRTAVSRTDRYALSAGIGYGGGKDWAVGLYANAQAMVATLPQLGIGFDLFGMIAPGGTRGGVHVTFVFEGHR